MPEHHPIDAKDWYSVYGAPRNSLQHLGSITIEELAILLSQRTVGKDFLVIDVRRADCTSMIPGAVNIPAHSLPVSLAPLLPLLSHIPLIVFHCSRSAGRAPRAAGWYADALQTQEMHTSEEIKKRVVILQGGIVRWEEIFGAGDLHKRGQKEDAHGERGSKIMRSIVKSYWTS